LTPRDCDSTKAFVDLQSSANVSIWGPHGDQKSDQVVYSVMRPREKNKEKMHWGVLYDSRNSLLIPYAVDSFLFKPHPGGSAGQQFQAGLPGSEL
jgi:hypothetical protein